MRTHHIHQLQTGRRCKAVDVNGYALKDGRLVVPKKKKKKKKKKKN